MPADPRTSAPRRDAVALPFRWHVQAWIAALVLLVGIGISLLAYLQLRAEAEREAVLAAERQAGEVHASLQAMLAPTVTALQVMGKDPAFHRVDASRWLERLPQVLEVLALSPLSINLYTGGADGRYMAARWAHDDSDRADFDAPGTTHVIVQLQQQPGRQEWLFYDAALRLIERRPGPQGYAFDPRTRPWYVAARGRDEPVRTAPFRFTLTRRIGITVALDTGSGEVLASNVRLEAIASALARLAGEGTVLLLFEEGGDLIASSGLPTQDAATLLDPARALVGTDAQRRAEGGWHLVNHAVGDLGLQLVTAVPDAQLYEEARRIRDRGLAAAALLLLVSLLASGALARRLSVPLARLAAQVESVRHFDFAAHPLRPTRIAEVESLAHDFDGLRDMLGRFLVLLRRLSTESDPQALFPLLIEEITVATGSGSGELWLLDGEAGERLAARHGPVPAAAPPAGGGHRLRLPLDGRRGDRLGSLLLVSDDPFDPAREGFATSISSFAALAMESRMMIEEQKSLFDAFVRLIADAVDAKSPHTGGHCRRVPELTERLVELAHASDAPAVADFHLDDDLREAVHIAAWLHDCGKVATPEYVVDKATKLETLHDRIHEVRMRFEVCKRDVELAYWRDVADGGDRAAAAAIRDAALAALDDDFAFVAHCNLGAERLDPGSADRLRAIAARTWRRTLDDTLGLSHEEAARRARRPAVAPPVDEPLLADRPEHRIARPPGQAFEADNPWGFTMMPPEWLYDRGELKNLLVERGTLSEEERYKINEHMVLTIRMLEALPFPRHLRRVPEIAAGHHERMDGRGYPRGLAAGEMSIPARLMAIADVFEALTATDRPYKRGKSVEEALSIMRDMAARGHLDPALFALFEGSPLPTEFARRHHGDATPSAP